MAGVPRRCRPRHQLQTVLTSGCAPSAGPALLKETPKAKGARGNPGGQGARIVPSDGTRAQTLADRGISYDQSSQWQRFADVPEDRFARRCRRRRAAATSGSTGRIVRPVIRRPSPTVPRSGLPLCRPVGEALAAISGAGGAGRPDLARRRLSGPQTRTLGGLLGARQEATGSTPSGDPPVWTNLPDSDGFDEATPPATGRRLWSQTASGKARGHD
jgi:hypothetical protein